MLKPSSPPVSRDLLAPSRPPPTSRCSSCTSTSRPSCSSRHALRQSSLTRLYWKIRWCRPSTPSTTHLRPGSRRAGVTAADQNAQSTPSAYRIVEPTAVLQAVRDERSVRRASPVIESHCGACSACATFTDLVRDNARGLMNATRQSGQRRMQGVRARVVDVRHQRAYLPARTRRTFRPQCAPRSREAADFRASTVLHRQSSQR